MTSFIIAILLLVPTIANAWYVTARTSPTTGQGTIAPSGTIYIASITATQDFVVTPAAGYAVSRVTLDGVNISPKAGTTDTYTVGYKAGVTYRNIVAYFAAAQGYSITVTLGANGSYRTNPIGQTLTNIPAGSSRTVVIIPYYGYQIDTLTAPGAVITDTNDGTGSKNVTYTNIQANKTINASFMMIPVVIANAGPDLSTQGNSAAYAVTLDGSLSTGNMGAMTYNWTATGPGIGVLSDPSAQKTTFYSTTPGTYTVALTVTSGGVVSAPDTALITVVSRTVYQEQICSQCHASRNPSVVVGYDASPHKSAAAVVVVCQTCHDPTNTGHYTVARPDGVCAPCHVTVTPQVVTDYQGSPHAANSITCATCHSDHSVMASSALCVTCHSTATPQVTESYQGSLHATNATRVVLCVDCHATHAVKTTYAICLTCHTSFPSNLGWHSGIPADNCRNCHKNPHVPENVTIGYPHFSNFTTAQYSTTNIGCSNCHMDAQGSFNVYSANHQWAKSGHGNPVSPAYTGPGPYTEANLETYDFKFLGTPLPAKPATTASQDCVRCHTATGYINYVTPTIPSDPNTAFSNIQAWGTPGDRTREMVACPACHTPTPFSADFSRRRVGIETEEGTGILNVVAWYGYSSAATKKIIRKKTFDDPAGNELRDSNICIVCHSGTAAGDLIKSVATKVGATGPFWQNVDFINPHNMGSAGLMYDVVKSGYEFRTSFVSPFHTNVGSGGSQGGNGPCVGCHMTSTRKHLFSVISTSSNGSLGAIRSTACADCHGPHGIGFLIDGVNVLQPKKEGYQAALAVIAAQLATRGIYYNAAVPPYFFTTSDPPQQTSATRTVNWDAGSQTFKGADVMGAAFNLRLLQSDAGAWAHNGTYTKRLLYDTINYLDDGNPNSGENSVINTIQSQNVDQTIKDKAQAYIVPRPNF